MSHFEPTRQAALARLAEVQPDAYARTRNALQGAVTRLSPYITHGLLSLREVHSTLNERWHLDAHHKLVYELGWRAYWHHVWSHLGDGIHRSQHAGVLPDAAYQTTLPDDVLQACTGMPVIDQAVRELYATGYLHNHARMWLASYVVHLRKVHWHAGAQWMVSHLLDGDVASNHLSWQWVAGTFSSKPYLFNAENVAKYAPPLWHSPGTPIDTDYDTLDRLARSPAVATSSGDAESRMASTPPSAVRDRPSAPGWAEPGLSMAVAMVAGRDVWLMHPWSLRAPPADVGAETLVIGLGLHECHVQTPWSERRWDFVTQGLKPYTGVLWWGSAQQIGAALQGARCVQWYDDDHARAGLDLLQQQSEAGQTPPRFIARHEAPLFETVSTFCPSFSKWWKHTRLAA